MEIFLRKFIGISEGIPGRISEGANKELSQDGFLKEPLKKFRRLPKRTLGDITEEMISRISEEVTKRINVRRNFRNNF